MKIEMLGFNPFRRGGGSAAAGSWQEKQAELKVRDKARFDADGNFK